MQSGNWRGARDPASELKGHVMQETHHKTYYTTLKKCSTGQIYRYRTGTSPTSTGTRTGPEPEFWSGPSSSYTMYYLHHFNIRLSITPSITYWIRRGTIHNVIQPNSEYTTCIMIRSHPIQLMTVEIASSSAKCGAHFIDKHG